MQIVDDKALMLRLRNPAKVTTVIPHSKELPDNKVLVKWGVGEAQTLKKLNIKNVPSPIERQYDWPGYNKPYDHQITTAAFLTMNRRAFCFNEQGCVDSETEYLSPTGWVKISEYTGGPVAQYHPDTRTAEFVEPSQYVKLPCSTMVHIKTKYGVDQMLSPEHRVLLEDGKNSKHKTETLQATELLYRHNLYHSGHRASTGGTRYGTSTIAFSASTIPTTFQLDTETSLDMSDAELRLQVAVIADGYFNRDTSRCAVRLKKERKINRLRQLLHEVGVEFVEKPCKPEGFTVFKFNAPRRDKVFTEYYWGADIEQRKIIAEESLHWDGCTTRGKRFSTSVKASADFIQYCFNSTCAIGGETARVTTSLREGRNPEYTVQARKADGLYLRGTDATMDTKPSTDGFKYCFCVPSTYLLFRRNGCVFASGNTGKTASAIWASDFLIKQRQVNRVLVICPLSIMDSAWRNDLFTFAMHRTVTVAHGAKEKRKKLVNSGAEYVIINYDGVDIVFNEIANGGFDLIIIDEATHYKNPQTKRWKTLNKLLKPTTWLWMMTGTPAAESPVDAYGIAKLVNPEGVPRYFSAWRDQVMYKVTQFKWAPKPDAQEKVFNALQPAIRYTKDECLDLPDMVYTKREVELTPQQKKYYKELKNKLVLRAAGEEVTAANAAIIMGKLLQISAGAVYTDKQEVLQFDIKHRYKVLREVIDESSKKVLIFVPFKHVIDILTEKLRDDGTTTEIIRGGVPASKRTEIFQAFQQQEDPKVLVIQPQSAAHGVTLTAANTVVWWGPTSSLETYAQANARVHRSGQDHKCTVVQLQGSAVEKRIYSLLDKRIDVHTKMIDLYNDLLD
jgi:superfamily II DNA or RNA helicase